MLDCKTISCSWFFIVLLFSFPCVITVVLPYVVSSIVYLLRSTTLLYKCIFQKAGNSTTQHPIFPIFQNLCSSFLVCYPSVNRHSKESQKEMKLLLDMYKEVAKESREKSEVCQMIGRLTALCPVFKEKMLVQESQSPRYKTWQCR